MDSNQLISALTDAAAAHNWIVVAVVALLLIVPLVLKMLGKDLPILNAAFGWVAGFLPQLRAATDPKPKPVDPSAPVEPSGLAKIVPIKEPATKEEGK